MKKIKTARPTIEELTAGLPPEEAKIFCDRFNKKAPKFQLPAASGCTVKEYEKFLDDMRADGLRFESIKYQLPNPASVPLPPPPEPPKKKTPEEMPPPFTMQGVGRKI